MWMGESFTTWKEAYDSGCKDCKKLIDEMPSITFTVVMYSKMWIELDIDSKGNFKPLNDKGEV